VASYVILCVNFLVGVVMVDTLEHYRAEADYIRKAALVGAERHYAAETPWYYAIYWLGIPSTILSAIAGAAAFSDIKDYSKWVAGACALAAAIFSALMTFLDPNKKAGAHHTTAKEYEVLYNRCGYFRRVELNDHEVDGRKAAESLKELSTALSKLNAASPAVSGRCHKAAERVCLGKRRGEVPRHADDIFTAPARAHNS
jgi:hypothetical protein